MMTEPEFVAEAIRRALAGDDKSGYAALKLCRDGLDANALSAPLRFYLAERLTEVLDGVRPDKALCIHKGPGRPKDPLPEWQKELGAFAALLTRRGYKPQQVAEAMCDQRSMIHNRMLDMSDAHGIRVTWAPMQDLGEDDLSLLAGPYGKVLPKYPPLT
jgi:hypothetical protein